LGWRRSDWLRHEGGRRSERCRRNRGGVSGGGLVSSPSELLLLREGSVGGVIGLRGRRRDGCVEEVVDFARSGTGDGWRGDGGGCLAVRDGDPLCDKQAGTSRANASATGSGSLPEKKA
jgi:hypothetical protein